METVIIEAKLDNINAVLVEINARLAKLNGTVAEHTTQIALQEPELRRNTVRLELVEDRVNSHGAYIEARKQTLKEFDEMREKLEDHQSYIDQQRGSLRVTAFLASGVGSFMAFVGYLILKFLKM